MLKPVLSVLCCLALLSTPARAQETPIKIVASFSILGDMIEQVGGNDVMIDTLVGPDEDAHEFQPSPEDAKRLRDAEIIAINGLHFEGWIGRLIKASGTKAKLLVASAGVHARVLNHADAPKGESVVDPHAWQDLRNGQLYIKNITAALIAARPNKSESFKERARTLIAKIESLDRKARERFSALPASERKIITTHDAFGYFSEAYGLTFLAPIGMNTEAQPSAADVANLIHQIQKQDIKVLFIENMTDPRLIEQIAEDTGARMGGTLYADALSKPDGEAPTYLEMMKVNIKRLLGSTR
ncbi:MAG: zinc ABC transporter substrate-binding protein [Alphaproteobacteria bacterium]|nr:zinc ABC transporter substrate-binding protein [Alphaproteobacteria bacterium]